MGVRDSARFRLMSMMRVEGRGARMEMEEGAWSPTLARGSRVEDRRGRMEKVKRARPLYWAENTGAGTTAGMMLAWNMEKRTSLTEMRRDYRRGHGYGNKKKKTLFAIL